MLTNTITRLAKVDVDIVGKNRKDEIGEMLNALECVQTQSCQISQAKTGLGCFRSMSEIAGHALSQAQNISNLSNDTSEIVQIVASSAEQLSLSINETSEKIHQSSEQAADSIEQANEKTL